MSEISPGLGRIYRQIAQHSAIYGAGHLLSRLASLALLPLYTRYLDPAAYGIQAILDLFGALLSMLVASAFAPAAGRLHFESSDLGWRGRVWWTAMWVTIGSSTAAILPLWLARDWLARWTLGSSVEAGSHYLALFLPTIVLGGVEYLLGIYLRIEKVSGLFVSLSLSRLLLNVILNVWLVVSLGLGLTGVLLGNLVTAVCSAGFQFAFLAGRIPIVGPDAHVLREMWGFGWPLMGAGVLGTLMHQADRYILLRYVSIEDVGVYSLAYQMGQGLNTMLLVPFASIWTVIALEIADHPDAERTYAEVFKYFVFGLSLAFMTFSLYSREVIQILTPREYWGAASLVPVICLGYLFWSMHDHFKLPATVSRRTISSLWVMLLATVVNIGANLLMVPRLGATGAAWASTLSFAVFAAAGLVAYRRIARYPYQFQRIALAVAGMGLTVLVLGSHTTEDFGAWHVLALRGIVVLAWAWVLFHIPLARYRAGRRSPAHSAAAPSRVDLMRAKE